VSENRVLKRIFEPKGVKVTGGWSKYIIRNFIICTPSKFYLSDQNKDSEIGWQCCTHGRLRNAKF
jgi:hypothetical protein